MESKVMPLITRCERLIKTLIVFYAVNSLSKSILLLKIQKYIEELEKKLPKDLIDRENYLKGVRQSAVILVNKCYVPIIYYFSLIQNQEAVNQKGKSFIIKKPVDLWSVAKGSPNVSDYKEKVNEALKNLDKNQLATHEAGKKPITLWQKTELDIRHDAQMEMVEKAVESGQDLYWLSSHPDCSKRCERWQGHLVSMSLRAVDSSLWTGKTVNGVKVYSFTDIENQVDKYGYKNNIINGFNCRHRLISYNNEKVAPQEFSKRDIKKERAINSELRAYERKIRELKIKSNYFKNIDKNKAIDYKQKANVLTEKYKAFANRNGFAWYEYRISV